MLKYFVLQLFNFPHLSFRIHALQPATQAGRAAVRWRVRRNPLAAETHPGNISAWVARRKLGAQAGAAEAELEELHQTLENTLHLVAEQEAKQPAVATR